MTDDLQERAREAASDLAFTLGNRVKLTDDCRTAINQAFLAFASPTPEPSGAVVEALRPFAEEAEEYDYGDGSGPDMKDAPDESSLREINNLLVGDLRRARTALASLDAGSASS